MTTPSAGELVSRAVLEHPEQVIAHLRSAVEALSKAHVAASEREVDRGGLNGPVRDMIFGLNTAVDTLAQMIEDWQ